MAQSVAPQRSTNRWRIVLAIVLLLAVLFVFFLISLTLVQYTESAAFCSSCHVMSPEATAYRNSPHARAGCGTCHRGPGALSLVRIEARNIRYLWVYPLNLYERPIETPIKSLRPVEVVCEQCHWPEKFYEDRLTVLPTFAQDKVNSLTRTALLMRTGGGRQVEGRGRGIHWHIENPVWYIASDEKRQEIPWVRAEFNGAVTEYLAAGSSLTAEQVAKAPKRQMDCVDCHNRATHVFRRPSEALDDALSRGAIPADLPEIKQQGVAVLEQTYATEAEAAKAIAAVADFYRTRYPDVANNRAADVQAAVAGLQAIFDQTQFPFMNVTWETHPDNIGHKDFPGCFRCHDGKHLSADKQAIRLECNICHSIPEVAAPGKPLPTVQTSPGGKEPDSHRSTTWLAEHRFKFDASCGDCHNLDNPGGSDNSSFCSNSACHGTQWKFIGLNAPQIRQLSAPPKVPSRGVPGPIPHPIGARTDCTVCHGPGKVLPAPENHATFKLDQCTVCHKPTLQEGAVPAAPEPTKPTTTTAPPTGVTTATLDLTATAKSPAVPFLADWQKAGHADPTAEAFKHWPTATEKEVPVTCAKCHSSEGYRDFLGADGSAANKVDKAVPTGSLIDCVACHNSATVNKTSVTFPSGVTLKNLGDEARCMECHQGRESTISVNAAIARSAMTETLDAISTISPTLGFRNIHYYAAAATQYGTLAKGGYEYAGKMYEAKFEHVEGYNTCASCHNPHTLEVELAKCQFCHTNVKAKADLLKIRMMGSLVDYDGDGDVKEGVQSEILGLQDKLYSALIAYSKAITQTGIAYNADAYPYFFKDTNGDGKTDEKEAVATNGWSDWTPRLLKAAYNYQVSKKDPGEFAHNGKYMIQLLYDSIEDLNTKLTTKIDLSKSHRDDAGHFAGAGEPFRHWDAEGEVPAGCVKCHTAGGLPEFLKNGGTVAITGANAVVTTGVANMKPSNGFACTTCHTDATKFGVRSVVSVPFPSGKSVTFSTEKDDKGNLKPVAANLCLECHQGRESTTTVNTLVKGIDDDKVDARVRFRNVHYFAAGASLFGDLAQGAYQYDGKKYVGKFAHTPGLDTCTGCHNTHELEPRFDLCVTCHTGAKSPADIRLAAKDYDGDKDVKEGVAAEVMGLEAKLYDAIIAYSKTITQTGIAYDAAAYPYFFKDTNGDGKVDAKEAVSANGWSDWTPRLLRATYNYQYVQKDPGIYAHNAKYAAQILYDALEDLGKKVKVDLTGLTRPE